MGICPWVHAKDVAINSTGSSKDSPRTKDQEMVQNKPPEGNEVAISASASLTRIRETLAQNTTIQPVGSTGLPDALQNQPQQDHKAQWTPPTRTPPTRGRPIYVD